MCLNISAPWRETEKEAGTDRLFHIHSKHAGVSSMFTTHVTYNTVGILKFVITVYVFFPFVHVYRHPCPTVLYTKELMESCSL